MKPLISLFAQLSLSPCRLPNIGPLYQIDWSGERDNRLLYIIHPLSFAEKEKYDVGPVFNHKLLNLFFSYKFCSYLNFRCKNNSTFRKLLFELLVNV